MEREPPGALNRIGLQFLAYEVTAGHDGLGQRAAHAQSEAATTSHSGRRYFRSFTILARYTRGAGAVVESNGRGEKGKERWTEKGEGQITGR